MTNSFKEEKWFWLKGGLYALVGSLCSASLIIQHPDPKTLVLLILIVWPFCRAYHHAFYVTEHYVDPGFKYMGLASFWDYMVDRSLRSESSEQPPRYSRTDTARENYQIKTLILNWIGAGILGCYFLPTAHSDCMRYISGLSIASDWIVAAQMVSDGFASAFYAALAVFASLAIWPFRYRVPVAFTLLAVFCSSQFVGLQDPSAGAVFGSFILPSAVFLFAFAVSWIARVLLGWRLVPRSSLLTASDKPRTGSQWGIAYLFLLSALVAIGVSLLNAMLPKDSGIELGSFQSSELLFGAAYLVELGVVTNAVLFIILASRLTLPGKWTFVGSLLVLLLAPIVLPLLLSLVTGNFTTTTANVCASYAFQVGLVVGLAILFLSARFASVRLLDRPMFDGAMLEKPSGLL